MKINETIDRWKNKLDISHWTITTEKIDSEQVIYDGETYFIGISMNVLRAIALASFPDD